MRIHNVAWSSLREIRNTSMLARFEVELMKLLAFMFDRLAISSAIYIIGFASPILYRVINNQTAYNGKTPTCYRPHKLKRSRSCSFPDSCDQCIQVSFAQDVRSPRSSHTSHPRRSTGELRWVALEGSKYKIELDQQTLWRH